jgi:hypothetical protein
MLFNAPALYRIITCPQVYISMGLQSAELYIGERQAVNRLVSKTKGHLRALLFLPYSYRPSSNCQVDAVLVNEVESFNFYPLCLFTSWVQIPDCLLLARPH